MNARTIQHPGIEIREIDLTEYKDTVTTNNAYVIGFTDRGPIYDYSWITTRSEFINLYGEPQTEAEKYLYYAVQSILNNGGTPIVARMPYDNKQCKAYKALKIKYASVAEDENSDTGFTLYDWATNDTQFSSNASALISLDRVGSYINPDGFETVLETLNNQHVAIAKNPATGTGEPETIVNPAELTYNNLLLSLNSDIAFEADLADDPTMENIASGLQLISKSIGFSSRSGHFDQDTNGDGIYDAISVNCVCVSSFTEDRVAEISECANNVSAEFKEVSDGIPSTLFGSLSGEIKTLSEFNDYFDFSFPSSIIIPNVAGSVSGYPESTKIMVSGNNQVIELGSVPGVISGAQATGSNGIRSC
jgi:hypothetical protein